MLDIKTLFDDRIRDKIKDKPDVMNLVLNHSAKEKCLTNLRREITLAYGVLDKIKLLGKQQLEIRGMINSVADLFIHVVLLEKEKELRRGMQEKKDEFEGFEEA